MVDEEDIIAARSESSLLIRFSLFESVECAVKGADEASGDGRRADETAGVVLDDVEEEEPDR